MLQRGYFLLNCGRVQPGHGFLPEETEEAASSDSVMATKYLRHLLLLYGY